jgi:hypothetical protein
MSDDSWRDGYDAWKLASPYDDEEEQYECDHFDYDIDILSGRAECCDCPHSWHATNEQISAEIERQAKWDAWAEREERRIRWRERFAFILDPIDRLRRRFMEWRARREFPEHANDDIPF